MILLAILLTISELLFGVFIHNHFFADTRVKPQVLGEVRNAPAEPEPSQFLVSTDLEKPSPKPKSAQSKASPAAKAVTITGIDFSSVLKALNQYRSKNGAGDLQTDRALQEYAQKRAEYLKSSGRLDKHAGHEEFMADGGFEKLGFKAIAENQGYNYKGDAKGLIESFYANSSGHNKNQLNPEYTHVGIGISGAFTNLVFGGRRK